MNSVTKKWIFLKISSIVLLPLMIWFIINFISIYDQNFIEVLKFFSNPLNKFLFTIFILFIYFFSPLCVSQAFERYISEEKTKNVANRLLYISAIVVPLLTIIILFNLNL